MRVLNLRPPARLNSRCDPRRKLNRRSGRLHKQDLKLAQHSRCDQSHVLRPRLVLKIVPSQLPTLRPHRGLSQGRFSRRPLVLLSRRIPSQLAPLSQPRPDRMSVLTRMSTRNRSKPD